MRGLERGELRKADEMACHSGSTNIHVSIFVLHSKNASLTIRNDCFINPRRTQPPLKTMILPLRRIPVEIEIPFNEPEEILHVVSTPAGVVECTRERVEQIVHSSYIIHKPVVNLEMGSRIGGEVKGERREKSSQCIRRWQPLEGT
jgi:hypothetical protein